MGRLYQSSTDDDRFGTFWQFEKALLATTGTAATLTLNAAASSSGSGAFHADGPGLNWGSTPYNGQIDVTAIGASTTLTGHIYRATTGGNSMGSILSIGTHTGTGLKSFSGSIPDVDDDPGRSVTDYLLLRVNANNSNMMSAESLTLRVNTADSYVDVPWSVGGPPPEPPRPQPIYVPHNTAVQRAGRW